MRESIGFNLVLLFLVVFSMFFRIVGGLMTVGWFIWDAIMLFFVLRWLTIAISLKNKN